jgi:hypothetical protein
MPERPAAGTTGGREHRPPADGGRKHQGRPAAGSRNTGPAGRLTAPVTLRRLVTRGYGPPPAGASSAAARTLAAGPPPGTRRRGAAALPGAYRPRCAGAVSAAGGHCPGIARTGQPAAGRARQPGVAAPPPGPAKDGSRRGFPATTRFRADPADLPLSRIRPATWTSARRARMSRAGDRMGRSGRIYVRPRMRRGFPRLQLAIR